MKKNTFSRVGKKWIIPSGRKKAHSVANLNRHDSLSLARDTSQMRKSAFKKGNRLLLKLPFVKQNFSKSSQKSERFYIRKRFNSPQGLPGLV